MSLELTDKSSDKLSTTQTEFNNRVANLTKLTEFTNDKTEDDETTTASFKQPSFNTVILGKNGEIEIKNNKNTEDVNIGASLIQSEVRSAAINMNNESELKTYQQIVKRKKSKEDLKSKESYVPEVAEENTLQKSVTEENIKDTGLSILFPWVPGITTMDKNSPGNSRGNTPTVEINTPTKQTLIENPLANIPLVKPTYSSKTGTDHAVKKSLANITVLGSVVSGGSIQDLVGKSKTESGTLISRFQKKSSKKPILTSVFPDLFRLSHIHVNPVSPTGSPKLGRSNINREGSSKWKVMQKDVVKSKPMFLDVLHQAVDFQKAKTDIAKKDFSTTKQKENMFTKKDKRKLGIVLLACMVEAEFPPDVYTFLGQSTQIKQIVKSFLDLSEHSEVLLTALMSI